MDLVSQSEFARMHGVTRQAIGKWKKAGWLEFVGSQVDVEKSNKNIERYRNATDGRVNPAVNRQPVVDNAVGTEGDAAKKILDDETPAQAADRILAIVGADMDIEEAKRVKENYLALLNQLEYDQKSGLVVPVADVAKVVGEDYAKVRTRLLAIPSEQAPRVHQCKTVTEVQDVLLDVLTQALEELTYDGGIK